jgi:hypothetical protein
MNELHQPELPLSSREMKALLTLLYGRQELRAQDFFAGVVGQLDVICTSHHLRPTLLVQMPASDQYEAAPRAVAHRWKVAGSGHQALSVFLHHSQRRSHSLQPCQTN